MWEQHGGYTEDVLYFRAFKQHSDSCLKFKTQVIWSQFWRYCIIKSLKNIALPDVLAELMLKNAKTMLQITWAKLEMQYMN